MSAPAQFPSTATPAAKIVIAGAGPAAQALVAQLAAAQFSGTVTVLSSRDDAPDDLMELAALPFVSVRFGQPASHIDAAAKVVTTADGMEFGYDQLVIATGSAPVESPVDGAGRCLSYSTIDDAATIGHAVKEVTRVLGRRPLGIWWARVPPPDRPKRCSAPAASGRSAPLPGPPPSCQRSQAPCCRPPASCSRTAAA
jgi:3-phenylpropionate/trans-cinnamate dioxygenase ferredoxin reductase subunit